jgi:hypothetical protein
MHETATTKLPEVPAVLRLLNGEGGPVKTAVVRHLTRLLRHLAQDSGWSRRRTGTLLSLCCFFDPTHTAGEHLELALDAYHRPLPRINGNGRPRKG